MPSSSGCSVTAPQPRTGQHASSSAPVSSSVSPGTSHGPFSHSPLLVTHHIPHP
ncbi:hypothetical protein Hamer_G030773 [Homarus americanus]|uniref:Uncharacterized protein n=1 Tax=Homarus americanus TaxID=6706 RepID=A0A8J5N0M8_HOMAM|nr:hypothetical protein Hamer_G030773 [Homarus americanus]